MSAPHPKAAWQLPVDSATGVALAEARPDVPRGLVTEHKFEDNPRIATPSRTVHFYRPAVDQSVPLLVVLDGQDYLERGRLTTIVDNLIAEQRIAPIAMALVDHGETARVVEYACNDATIGFLGMDVLRLAREQLDLVDPKQAPGAFGIMGASMGGLMSLYAGLRVPEVFGRVLSQSGAFGLHSLVGQSVIWELLASVSPAPLKIWLDVGMYEPLLDSNRAMHRLLQERGYEVTYVEQNGGHDYPSWQNALWRGLECLFPPDNGEV